MQLCDNKCYHFWPTAGLTSSTRVLQIQQAELWNFLGCKLQHCAKLEKEQVCTVHVLEVAFLEHAEDAQAQAACSWGMQGCRR